MIEDGIVKFEVSAELDRLLNILMDWARPGASAEFYLFGSRVSGNYRGDSDVDISVRFFTPADDLTTHWWGAQNDEDFKTINAKLPGPIHVQPNYTDVNSKVQSSEIVYSRGNIHCVWLKRKQL